MMGDRLKGKVAIVTGAGGGIGRGEALTMVSEGARIVVNDLGCERDGTGSSREPADDVVEEIKKLGGEAVASYESVATSEGCQGIVKTAIDTFGRLDVLVNNAGFLRDRMVFNMTGEDWDAVVKTHLYGSFYMTKYACRIFREQRSGRIINTSSAAGMLGETTGQSNYGAAKAGIVGLTRQTAMDMGRYGVTCNAIRPNAATRITVNEEVIKAYEKAGRMDEVEKGMQMKPEDVAPLVVWLASDAAANVNGRVFYSARGKIALYSEPTEIKAMVKHGAFTIDELFDFMPETMTADIINPSPPKEKK